MTIQQRLLTFIVRANWILLAMAGLIGYLITSLDVTMGIIAGGLIVTINFHLLYRTLKRSLKPSNLTSPKVVIVKYYIRFTVSALIIILLITQKIVNPLGLFIGLSVVVASIFLATLCEINKQICKEAV